ncbi:MAG: histidinol phosphatase-like enzyme, partial [Planctomycetota bacterium]
RGLFIDRWGTLLEQPAQGFVSSFSEASFTPSALEALFHAGEAGWNLYLIGNESSVSTGKQSAEAWQEFEAEMLAHLEANGIAITRCYACLDDPVNGKPPHDRDSVFLLPNTGVLYHACQVDSIVLRESWVVGDSSLELVSGWRAGCKTAGVRTGQALTDGNFEVELDLVCGDLAEGVSDIVGTRVMRRAS